MANEVADERALVTRTVSCPRCRADATLSYAAASSTPEQSSADNIVYLCPSMCTFAPHEIAALLDRHR